MEVEMEVEMEERRRQETEEQNEEEECLEMWRAYVVSGAGGGRRWTILPRF